MSPTKGGFIITKEKLQKNLNELIGEELNEELIMNAVHSAFDDETEYENLNLKYKVWKTPGMDGNLRDRFFVYTDVPANEKVSMIISGIANFAGTITEVQLYDEVPKLSLSDAMAECLMLVGQTMDYDEFISKVRNIVSQTSPMSGEDLTVHFEYIKSNDYYAKMLAYSFHRVLDSGVFIFAGQVVPNPKVPKEPDSEMMVTIDSCAFRRSTYGDMVV